MVFRKRKILRSSYEGFSLHDGVGASVSVAQTHLQFGVLEWYHAVPNSTTKFAHKISACAKLLFENPHAYCL
jgi:hypothetical protein